MRNITRAILFAAAYAAAPAACLAEGLAIELSNPKFRVSIPGQPEVQFGPHPMAAANPAARILGMSADGMTVSALTQEAKGANIQQCASWLVGSTLSRFSPDLATVQLFPAGANAWVLIYVSRIGPIEQLKAHVFSGNGKGHCLEVHMSRTNATEPQRQAWNAAFRDASVEAE